MSKGITELLQRVSQGENELLDDVYTQLYDEIKAIAYNQIQQLNTGETISPTVMAHECYIKLAKKNNINLSNKSHFLNYLAKSMRLLLVDIYRNKSSLKRHHLTKQQSYSLVIGEEDVKIGILDIDHILNKIERINKEYSQLLEYRLLLDLSIKEISSIIEKSERQVLRIWNRATALFIVLSKGEENESKHKIMGSS